MVTSAGLAPLEVDRPAEWVSGLPNHAAVTVRATDGDSSFGSLPLLTLERVGLGLGIQVSDSRGARVVSVPARARVDARPSFDLDFGERRRMLVDVSGLLKDVGPGSYSIQLSYGTKLLTTESEPFAITIREPTLEEGETVRALRAEGAGPGDYGEWSNRRRPLGAPWVFTTDAALRWLLLRNQLLFGPQEPRDVDLAVLDGFDALHRPEAEALRAELLSLRGGAEAQIERVRKEWPGLKWWMDRLEDGSPLAVTRELNREAEP